MTFRSNKFTIAHSTLCGLTAFYKSSGAQMTTYLEIISNKVVDFDRHVTSMWRLNELEVLFPYLVRYTYTVDGKYSFASSN